MSDLSLSLFLSLTFTYIDKIIYIYILNRSPRVKLFIKHSCKLIKGTRKIDYDISLSCRAFYGFTSYIRYTKVHIAHNCSRFNSRLHKMTIAQLSYRNRKKVSLDYQDIEDEYFIEVLYVQPGAILKPRNVRHTAAVPLSHLL